VVCGKTLIREKRPFFELLQNYTIKITPPTELLLLKSFIDKSELRNKKTVSIINVENPPVLTSIIKAGFKEEARIKVLGQLNRKICV